MMNDKAGCISKQISVVSGYVQAFLHTFGMVGNFANMCHRGRRSFANEEGLHYELNIEERARDTCDEYLGMGKRTWDLGVGATLLRGNTQAHW